MYNLKVIDAEILIVIFGGTIGILIMLDWLTRQVD